MNLHSGMARLLNEARSAPTVDHVVDIFKHYINKKAVKKNIDNIVDDILREARAFRNNTVKLNKLLENEEVTVILNNLSGMRRGRAYWMQGTISIPMLDSGIHQLKMARTNQHKLLALARLILMIGDHEDRTDPGTLYPYLMEVDDWSPAKRSAFRDMLQVLSSRVVNTLAQQVVQSKQGTAPRPLGW